MGRDPGSGIAARIVTTLPLLRVGLEGAATHAGLSPVGPDGHADLVLRSADQPPTLASVDIASGIEEVVLTVRAQPDAATWEAIRELVHLLLPGESA